MNNQNLGDRKSSLRDIFFKEYKPTDNKQTKIQFKHQEEEEEEEEEEDDGIDVDGHEIEINEELARRPSINPLSKPTLEEVVKNRVQPIPNSRSLFIFGPKNRIRRACHYTCNHRWFTNSLLICILVSSILLAAEDPVRYESKTNDVLLYFDYFFTTVFTIEISLKLIAYGFVLHKGSLCRNPSDILDIFVVFVSLLSIFLPHIMNIFTTTDEKLQKAQMLSVLKVLRILRVLRPLRAINRAKGLKHVVNCLVVALKTIRNIVVVTLLLKFMFSCIGVQLFKGALFHCSDLSKLTESECHGTYYKYSGSELSIEERVWENNNFHFDNVLHGMETLFTVTTFEGWPALLYKAIDSTKEYKGPIYNNRKAVAIFFIAYIVVIAFFMVNIFVGFVIVTFQNEGEQEFKNSNLDKNQRSCIEFVLKCRPYKRYIPSNVRQYKIWWFVTSNTFEYTIFTTIILNTIVLSMNYYNAAKEYKMVLNNLNIFFTVVFTIEFIFKILAFRIKQYFRDSWNILDFIIVAGSIFDIIMIISQKESHLKFLRLFRVMRLLKLLSRNEGIRTLLWTFVKSFQVNF
jgi:voltage-dependent calcium channel L type alpha-1D